MVDGDAHGLEEKATAGDEEDGDVLLDSQLPAAIPWTRMERAVRRILWCSSICSRLLQSPAMCASTASSVSAVVGKKKREGGSRGE